MKIQKLIKSIIGEGIIILLCGPPGVGKTLTAEAGLSNLVSYAATGC
jgi:SpoVK/Ycf46/Vps4 family AAA+-type ATPase